MPGGFNASPTSLFHRSLTTSPAACGAEPADGTKPGPSTQPGGADPFQEGLRAKTEQELLELIGANRMSPMRPQSQQLQQQGAAGGQEGDGNEAQGQLEHEEEEEEMVDVSY